MRTTIVFVIGVLSWLPQTGSSPADGCGNWPAVGFEDAAMRRFTGDYSNPNYGLAVRIPQGLTGHDGPAPNPHHGFGIVLSWEPRAFIDVDGSYNSLAWSPAQMESWYLERLREESERVISAEPQDARLGSLSARRLIVRRTCKGHAGTFVADQTVALSAERGIVYSATLLTTEDRYEGDRTVLDGMLKTWKLVS